MGPEHRFLIEKANAWINPLTERGGKIEAISENVEALRDRTVATGHEEYDSTDNVFHRKRFRRKFGNQRLTFIFEAPDKDDVESSDNLGYVLKIGIVLGQVPANGRKTLDLTFRYDAPEFKYPITDEPTPHLYCHIFADDSGSGNILGADDRRITDLLPHEIEMINDLTTTAVELFS